MAEQATTISPSFQIRAVELHEVTIIKPPISNPPITNFNFEINLETNVDVSQKIVLISTKIKINANDKITHLGSISCACVFSISNFEDVISINDNTFIIEESFAETLNALSISTTRGVMYSELKGTALHYAFLPIIDVKSLSKAEPVKR